MRVLIMADMEGVSGIVTWGSGQGRVADVRGIASPVHRGDQCRRARRAGRRARPRSSPWIATAQAATGHSIRSFPNCSHPDCEWVAHHKWSRYTELLEKGCDAALMVGMHARAGTPDGVLCHTISTVTWRNLWFNNDLVGELGINAALCGHYGCPVALVTGDDAIMRESREILSDDCTYVSVKKGLSRYSARQIPPVRARQMIEDGAREALTRAQKGTVYVPAKPTTITIEVDTVDKVGQFRGREGVEVVDTLKVRATGADWMTAWDLVWPQADI